MQDDIANLASLSHTWVVVDIMVPFWVPTIIRHLIFRVPKKGDQGSGVAIPTPVYIHLGTAPTQQQSI